jgi:hypothetical protein
VSFIAWLDTSPEQQKRMREIVRLFEDTETIDELGIGQIRDTFSNLLFPGTSVLLTRARYYLFVPWAFQLAAERKKANPAAILTTAENYERSLIEGIRKSGDLEGLIGRQAGTKVRTLPSQIYWGGLASYGILAAGISRQQISHPADPVDGSDELTERRFGHWSPTLPARPTGFPYEAPAGFALTPEEAGWLRERILTSVPNSLLARLTLVPGTTLDATDADPVGPWDACRTLDLSDEIKRYLDHAELFSLAIHGAALLYNLMAAELFSANDFSNPQRNVEPDFYQEWFTDWSDQIRHESARFDAWDLDDFWLTIRSMTPQIPFQTVTFVQTWLTAVRSGAAFGAPESPELRSLIERREMQKKGRLARLTNKDQLKRWAGDSGTGRLVHRWPTIRGILRDIEDGLQRAGS